MITARPQKKLEHARQYFREHLAHGEYHSEGQTVAGDWFGKGAARLGLDPAMAVDEQAFIRLCRNQHPRTGATLTVRHRAERRIFYDFVVSAPKSASILALTVGDPRIVAAHDTACRSAMVRMERVASTRVRKGGARSERITGEIVAASFRHDSSRALDPQLHTHFVIFNATWDAEEARWKALEPSAMFEQIAFFTEVYRSELAAGLKAAGYELRDAPHGYEIAGVSDDTIARFSQRSQAIAEAEAALGARLKGPLTKNGRAALAHAVRPKKQRNLTANEIVIRQRARLSNSEWKALEQLVRKSVAKPEVPRHSSVPEASKQRAVVEAALDYARDHLFERRSVVQEHQLLRVAMSHGRGRIALPELEAALLRRTEFIRIGNEITTRGALHEERRMLWLVAKGKGKATALAGGYSGSTMLGEDQRQALRAILCGNDRVMALRGPAGSGKSTLLREIAKGIEKRGKIAVVAPTTAAVEVLRREGFADAETLQWLLGSEGAAESVRGRVVLVDEAGMLSNRQMIALLELAETRQCRLILSGDTRQHGGVEAGDALRILETQSTLQTVEVKSLRRQVDAEYRAAISDLANGDFAHGLGRLERLGAVLELGEQDGRHERLAEEYVSSIAAGKSALIVTPTWREAGQATEAVRSRLQAAGRIGSEDVELEVHHPLKWTKAEKRDLQRYRAGHVLVFHGSTKDFRSGEHAEVVAVADDRLSVRRADRTVVTVTKKQAGCFEVAECRTLSVTTGDKLQLRGNFKQNSLINGQMVTVKSVGRNGLVELEDGRRIPPEFKLFTHGYAVTSYGSQSKTVDHVFVAMDSHSGDAINQRQFYVSVSRGRERVRIYTDDVDFLREAVARPGIRQSASELLHAERVRHAASTQVDARQGLSVGG